VKIADGIELLEEREGEGAAVVKGDHVVYNIRIFLNKGDEVFMNEAQAQHLPPEMKRREGGRIFIDHRMVLGKRRAIPGIERTLMGMRPGGYRKVRVSPHLAYRDKGLLGLIPADAVLVIEIWLREVTGAQ
jgi:FKBP-type peptidyl-prolyl cis-trans isomerase